VTWDQSEVGSDATDLYNALLYPGLLPKAQFRRLRAILRYNCHTYAVQDLIAKAATRRNVGVFLRLESRKSLVPGGSRCVARYHRAQTLARPYSNISLSFRLTPSSLRMKTDQSPRLIADGNTNKEIAAQLSIVEDTVKGQVRNILSKLGANDRTHAAMIGLKRGIIEL
jgi:hypothetical protein